jgi:hypothetical protein
MPTHNTPRGAIMPRRNGKDVQCDQATLVLALLLGLAACALGEDGLELDHDPIGLRAAVGVGRCLASSSGSRR